MREELGSINNGSCKASTRAAGFVTFAAKDRPTDLGLKWYLIVFPAMVTNDLELCRSILADSGLFRTAFCAPLRRHHVALVKYLLLFLGKQKRFFALNANGLNIRHCSIYSSKTVLLAFSECYHITLAGQELVCGIEFDHVFANGLAERFEIVAALEARDQAPFAGFVRPVQNRSGH